MRAAVFGTGAVGQTLAPALTRLGHEVVVGTRDPEATRVRGGWTLDLPLRPYDRAAKDATLVVNATNGVASLAALGAAGADLDGVVLLDVANPLDFSGGFPPSLAVHGSDSLAEQIQRAFPRARVVKSLNTVNCKVMVDPGRVGDGDTTMYVAGDDPGARSTVLHLLEELGWRDLIEFDDLAAARGMESWLALWVRLVSRFGSAEFNVKVVR